MYNRMARAFIGLLLCSCIFLSLAACGKSEGPKSDDLKEDVALDSIFQPMELNPEEDFDGDGLLNKEETVLKTNPLAVDTDLDGISDYDEVKKYHTDPLVKDTDKDTVGDGLEVHLQLDPLNKKSDGKTEDGKRQFEKEFDYKDSVKLAINGGANAIDVLISEVNVVNFKKTPGVCSALYEVYNGNNKFESARLTLKYDPQTVSKKSSEENLVICQMLPDGTFREVGGTVDTAKKTVSAELDHFSYYFVADKTVIQKKQETDVYLLIDNSGSMYPKELCESSEENDVDFKRIDMAKKLISMTDDTVHYGLAKFTKSFMPLSGFTDDKADLFEKLDAIKTQEEEFNGTYIATSLVKSIEQFAEISTNRKIIIMLTDGATTEGVGLFSFSWYDENDAIRLANKNDITIIAIGLGSGVNPDYLTKITSGTDGFYVFANDADALDRVYETLMAALNYGFVDLDGDGTCDHILMADTGFDLSKNAWQIRNYDFISDTDGAVIDGQCAGMAASAQLYYRGRAVPKTGRPIDRYLASGFLAQQYLSSTGYDVSSVEFFRENHNLADFKLFGDLDALLLKRAGDRYVRNKSDDKYLEFNDNIKNAAKEYPHLVQIQTKTYDKEEIWSNDNKPYNKADRIVYTIHGVNYDDLTEAEKNAYNVLKMINWFYVIQSKTEYFTKYDIASVKLEIDIKEQQFEKMVSRLEAGVPLIVGGASHAVNAIKIYKKIDNAFEYVVGIYDNNDPTREKHLTITKVKDTGIDINAWFNEYEYRIIDTDGIFGSKGADITTAIDFYEINRDALHW